MSTYTLNPVRPQQSKRKQDKGHNFLPSLNGIRAISIILVVGSHANRSLNFPEPFSKVWGFLFNGELGVNVFFSLSGFLITYLLLLEEKTCNTISLKRFYIRRILRIFPVYYVLLFVYLLLQIKGIFHFSLCQWVSSLTYTKNFGCGAWVDGHLWSLSVEEQFYLLWPFIFKFFKKKGRKQFCFSILCLAPLLRIIFYKYGSSLYRFSFFTNADCLMWGCVAAIYLQNIVQFIKRKNRFLFPSILCLLIISVWYLQNLLLLAPLTVPFSKTIYSICASLLIVTLSDINLNLTKTKLFYFLNSPVMDYIGKLSYSIYIWQQLFFAREASFLNYMPVNIFIIFIVANISFLIVEKPLLNLKNKFSF